MGGMYMETKWRNFMQPQKTRLLHHLLFCNSVLTLNVFKCHLGVVSHILYYLYLQRNVIIPDRCHLLKFLILWMLYNLLVILVLS